MKGFFALFKRSAKELKNMRCLVTVAMLIALDIVIKLTIDVHTSDTLHISFAFVALSAISMLYGPSVGFAAGVITDLLGFILKPSGAFDIRFTLIEGLGALIYGVFLYNAKHDKWFVPRIIAAKTAVVAICNLWLTTWAVASLAGKGFLAMFPARAIKNIIQLPIDIIILSLLLPLILKAWQSVPGNRRFTDEKLLFCDENVGRAMIVMTALIMVVVCSVAYGAQSISDSVKELKSRVDGQQEAIDRLDEEMARVLEEIGVERGAGE